MSRVTPGGFINSDRRRLHRGRTPAVITSVISSATGVISLPLAFSPQVAADTSPPSGLPATMSADLLPTVQIDGVAWAEVVVGNTVYVTGSFANARPAGTPVNSPGRVARANLLAHDITTGNLITTFDHRLNGQGLAGSIVNAAVCPSVLTTAKIQSHFLAAGGTVDVPPTAAFSSDCPTCRAPSTVPARPTRTAVSPAMPGISVTGALRPWRLRHTFTRRRAPMTHDVLLTVTDTAVPPAPSRTPSRRPARSAGPSRPTPSIAR
jgi:hypothetical protein